MIRWIRPQLFWIMLSHGHRLYGAYACSRCQNSKCLEDESDIAIHLCKNGFVPGYEVWTFHSESGTRVVAEDEYDCNMGNIDRMD
jgi:hypothetical protein